MQKSKYMLANERDQQWGLTVSTVGYEEIGPGEPYPTRGHADGYYFNLEEGRELNEYQLLYIPEGSGIFHSTTVPETELTTLAEMNPDASPMICPIFTVSPTATTGVAGAPIC